MIIICFNAVEKISDKAENFILERKRKKPKLSCCNNQYLRVVVCPY